MKEQEDVLAKHKELKEKFVAEIKPLIADAEQLFKRSHQTGREAMAEYALGILIPLWDIDYVLSIEVGKPVEGKNLLKLQEIRIETLLLDAARVDVTKGDLHALRELCFAVGKQLLHCREVCPKQLLEELSYSYTRLNDYRVLCAYEISTFNFD